MLDLLPIRLGFRDGSSFVLLVRSEDLFIQENVELAVSDIRITGIAVKFLRDRDTKGTKAAIARCVFSRIAFEGIHIGARRKVVSDIFMNRRKLCRAVNTISQLDKCDRINTVKGERRARSR